MKSLWAKLKAWWENNKNVVLNFVLPKLEGASGELAKLLKVSEAEAKRIIAVISDYLKRQV